MVLVFDIGNTDIVFGLMEEGVVQQQFRFAADKQKSTDEYAISLLYLLDHSNVKKADIEAVMISSVVPPLTYTISRLITKYLGVEPVVVDAHSDHGLNICIDVPSTLGSDRLMSAVAAYTLYRTNCITVDHGTATTLEIITSKGDFLGGVIFPGVKLSANALHMKTAQLPQVELLKPESVVGKNTISSIQSGLYYGYVEMVDGIIDRIIEEVFGGSKDNLNIILTGGMGSSFLPSSRHHMKYEPSLIMYGLYFVYERLKISRSLA